MNDTKVQSLLLTKYKSEVVDKLIKEYDYKNVLMVPKLDKVVINMGLGRLAHNSKYLQNAINDLWCITGQKPMSAPAKKSIAQFKIRANQVIGIYTTLRNYRMWEFLDRLLILVIPRIRDFRGFVKTKFDGHGNYSFGLREQTSFYEINLDKVDAIRGMNITITTTSNTNKEALSLLSLLGFPFIDINK